MVDLSSFVVMAGITTLFGLVAASVTLIIGAMVTNVQVGVQLTPLVFVPQLLFAGFYIPIDDIPVYMRWAQYLCSLKYAVNLLLIEEMKDVPDTWPSATTQACTLVQCLVAVRLIRITTASVIVTLSVFRGQATRQISVCFLVQTCSTIRDSFM